MAERRASRASVLIAGGVAGALLLTAGPQGQQIQGRSRGQVSVPQVPTVAAPRVPTIGGPQVPQSVTSYRPINPARLEAFMEASRRGLNYLPGEVLVKFKDGVNAEGQTRALQTLGSGQTADTIEWAGVVAVVRDKSQLDAYILADQLRNQPEVEYAEPNFIGKIDPSERAAITAPATFSSVGLLFQPVMAALFAWMLLGETLGSVEIAGGVAVLVGIAVAHRAEVGRRPQGA